MPPRRGVPVVAIGGITLENAALVAAAGAASVAVLADVFTGGDPEARTRAFLGRPWRAERRAGRDPRAPPGGPCARPRTVRFPLQCIMPHLSARPGSP